MTGDLILQLVLAAAIVGVWFALPVAKRRPRS
jgi:hypothetical protein